MPYDETGGENIAAATALWEEYKRRQEAEKAAEAARPLSLYERLSRKPAVAGILGAGQGAAEGVKSLVDAAAIPARGIAGAATKLYEGTPEFDLGSYALYGFDPETGRGGIQYGDLLAGTLEDQGEIAPGGTASKIIRTAGNMVTDPVQALALVSGAEAAGALAGRLTGPKPPMPTPAGRLVPGYEDNVYAGPGVPKPPYRPPWRGGDVSTPPVKPTPGAAGVAEPTPAQMRALQTEWRSTPRKAPPRMGEVETPPKMKLYRGGGKPGSTARRPGGHRFRPRTRKPKFTPEWPRPSLQ